MKNVGRYRSVVVGEGRDFNVQPPIYPEPGMVRVMGLVSSNFLLLIPCTLSFVLRVLRQNRRLSPLAPHFAHYSFSSRQHTPSFLSSLFFGPSSNRPTIVNGVPLVSTLLPGLGLLPAPLILPLSLVRENVLFVLKGLA